jgi:cation diffusion facilitator CzcD-associated flavoprotein CzcO
MRDRGEVLDAAVVGGGFAGLAVSGALKTAGLSHVVFEKSRPCQTWMTQRWDSFRMNTPNVLTVMPGETYPGPDPEGAMTRDEFVASVLANAVRRALPVESGTGVSAVEPNDRGGFDIHTPQGVVQAHTVVATTGNLNVPKRPALAARLPASVAQIDGSDYRNAGDLRPGAVLVVGCGNSGGQIAEDIALGGRAVFLATGRNGRVPRRYRGRDIILWLMEDGRYDQPRTAQSGRPLLGATHTISFGSLSALGITLLGRVADVTAGGTLVIADDVAANAAHADIVSAEIRREIDEYIARQGIDAEPTTVDAAEAMPARFPTPTIRELDLTASGITTVIWSVGFCGDYRWLRVPGATDAAGQPVQSRCLSVPGIYFAGLDSLEALKSGTIMVAAGESRRVADHIAARLERSTS